MRKRGAELMELLSAYLDGEVTPRERAEAEELLRSDGEARELFRRLKRTSGLLGEMDRLHAPAQLHRRVMGAVSQRKRRLLSERLLSAWAPAPALAAAFSVVIIATVVYFAYFGGLMQPPAPDDEVATGIADVRTPPTDRDEEQEKDFAITDEVEEEALGEQSAPTAGAGAEPGVEGTAVAGEPREERAREESPAVSGLARGDEEPPAASRQPEMDAVTPEREASDDLVAAEQPAAALSERTQIHRRAETADLDATGLDASLKRPGIFSARERTYGYYAEGADYETSNRFYVSESSTHIAERGRTRQLVASAQPGDDRNPLFDPGTFTPPRLPAFDFFGRGERAGVQELQVFGEAHVARDGTILYLRLVGNISYSNLIDAFADHLLATRLIPARREQNTVSVFYNFVVVIRATE